MDWQGVICIPGTLDGKMNITLVHSLDATTIELSIRLSKRGPIPGSPLNFGSLADPFFMCI
jgi:hypothetical protein